MLPLFQDRLSRALATICAAEVLLVAVAWFASSPPSVSLEKSGRESIAAGSDATGLEPVSRESFRAFTQRPLFVAARRPIAQASPAGAGSGDGVVFGRYRFTGVAVTPNLRIAFVTDAETNRSLAVSEGDKLGDWTILEIKREGLTLQSAGRKETVLFRRP
jgi:hypothetical protein